MLWFLLGLFALNLASAIGTRRATGQAPDMLSSALLMGAMSCLGLGFGTWLLAERNLISPYVGFGLLVLNAALLSWFVVREVCILNRVHAEE
ncbi:MAG: hypothetical protein HYY17_14700 [Planctomycetes bacterium]|nr:hypothetical protein [Planctomycetota bacterium]